MKHTIFVKDGSQVIGIASNLKKVVDATDSEHKQGYSTIALTVSLFRPYKIGSGRINGMYYENLSVEKYQVNRFPGS